MLLTKYQECSIHFLNKSYTLITTKAIENVTKNLIDGFIHGLRTPNEGINQRYLNNWADVADKICFGRT